MFNPNEHLLNLKGKDYLQVMWRLVWFREERPLWNINTSHVEIDDVHAIFVTKIYDEAGNQKASGYGSETIKDFHDYIEKAETKSIGRALAMLGYGTQFSPELDEGERIVDSPVSRKVGQAERADTADTAKATKAQLDTIYRACDRDADKFADILAVFGYSKSSDVLASDVDQILIHITAQEELPFGDGS